jgi:hypothetical protein
MAARYWVGGGSSANWNATAPTNWSATSGGAGNASVPNSTADTANFDGAGGSGNSNCTLSAIASVNALVITAGYTATMTHNAVLTIGSSGSIWTFHNGYTIAGTSGVTITSSITITSGGMTWPNNVSITSTYLTRTITGDFKIGGRLIMTAASTFNGDNIYCNGLTGSFTGQVLGTSDIYITGGTWSCTLVCNINNDIYIDGASGSGTITISGNVYVQVGTLTYISGTVNATGSTLNMINHYLLNTNGMTLGSLAFITNSSIICTLQSNLTLSGNIIATTLNNVINGAFIVYTAGLTMTNGFGGTATIELTGGGTWSGTGVLTNNLVISGNTTISASSGVHNTGTITGSTGTVTGTLQIQGSAHTIDTAGVTWDSITFGTFTYTINALLTASGTIASGGSPNFAGTSGWTCATFSHTGVTAFTVTFKEAVTYTVTTLLSAYESRTGSSLIFTSAHGTTKANLTLSWGATCRCLSNFTRIDASGGRPIRAFNSTITDCVYIQSISDLKTMAA